MRSLLILLASALAALLTLGPTNAADAAQPAAQAANAKPTIVLVHGAWADSSSWNKVILRLQAKGYTVKAPPNPLRGLGGDSAYISDYLSVIPGPIVLVGHSYGGAVITNAAKDNPNVQALVYIDAFAPAEGEPIVALAGAESALNAPPETVFDFAPYPGAPAGDFDLYLKQDVFLNSFMQDVPEKQALVYYAGQKPAAASGLAATSGPPAWEDIPSWYLIGTQDRVITPDAQEFMAQRAGSDISYVDSSHVPLVSRPAAVTKTIVKAVWQS
jgi:pimeloyl-ACP methyl ester carboxylesterase